MTFLNASLLVALAAIGIPIALHLIARKEPRQVLFPSVRLLAQRFETNRSKVRVRRWWLLALRIATLAVVALALAQPVIAGTLSLTWSTIGIVSLAGIALLAMASVAANKPNQKTLMWSLLGAACLTLLIAVGWGGYTLASGKKPEIDSSTPVALAIVVDNAPLASWQTAQQNQLQNLRDAAKQLLLAAHRDSRLALIDRSSTPAAFALDLSGAIAKADDLPSLEVVQPLESRIEAAIRLLQTSDLGSRQLVVLSSLAASSFSDDVSRQNLAALGEESGVRITVWDVGGFSGVNRSVSIPTLSDASPAPDTAITVAAIVSVDESRAGGSQSAQEGDDQAAAATDRPTTPPTESVRVTAECVLFPSSPSLPVLRDGQILRPEAKPVDRISVQVQPGRDVELQMTLPPLPIGLHHGAIRLIGEDALAIDDTGYFSVAVLPPSRLLIVGDQTEEASEIAWAVSVQASSDAPSPQYQIETIGFDDLAAASLAEFDGVMLLDPPPSALSDSELQRYRATGGSVMLVAGGALGHDPLAIDGWPRFLRRWRVAEPGTFLAITAASHPVLNPLATTAGGVPFQDFRVRQYWQVDPPKNSLVLMRYAGTDHAALVELTDGDSTGGASSGRGLVLTTPIPELASPSNAWNELFSAEEPWPAFALVRALTRYLTGRSNESWTSMVGAPVSILIRNDVESVDLQRRLQWFPPVGSNPIPVDVPENTGSAADAATRVVVGQPKNSGVHWIRGDDQGLGFTVNLPRERLAPRRVEEAELEQLFGNEQYRRIQSLEEMEWSSGDGSQGVSLWSPIMLLALLVFLLEQVLGNRFYRRPPAAASDGQKRRSAA
jgi:hypothetical protein